MSGLNNIEYYENLIEILTKKSDTNNDNLFEINFSNMCRTCLSEAETLNNWNYSIKLPQLTFNDSIEHKLELSDMLFKTTGVKIEDYDDYPKQMCNECIANLHRLYYFKMQSERADRTLTRLGDLLQFGNEISTFEIGEGETSSCTDSLDKHYLLEENIEFDCSENRIENFNDTSHLSSNENLNQLLSIEPNIEIEEILSNSSNKLYECEMCEIVFKTRKLFEIHVKDIHPNEKYHKCEKCSLAFNTLKSYRRHQKVHQSNPVVFLCSFCAKEFLRTDELRRHVRTHTNERPYKCHVCPKAFKQSSELKEHMLVHQSERSQFVCKICKKKFKSRYGIYVHMKTHANVRNHKCNECDISFSRGGELQSHMKNVHQSINENNL